MFGPKTKSTPTKATTSVNAGSSAGSNAMAAVAAKIDTLQTTIRHEQQADAGEVLQNSIGRGTIIEGNVHAEGDLLIEGVVKGDVTTKTKLLVGANAVIEGNILAQHAEIAGRVQGTVKALGLLVINSSGTILGDVITKDLNVESGSTFNGRLQVGGNVSTTPIQIPKVNFATASAPAASALADSVFDAPAKKPAEKAVVMPAKSDADKTADQLAANLAKSALLH